MWEYFKKTKIKDSSGKAFRKMEEHFGHAMAAMDEEMSALFGNDSEKALAELLCSRLNRAIKNPEIQRVAQTVFRTRVQVTNVVPSEFRLKTEDSKAFLSTLGLINGLLEDYKIVAVYQNRSLVRFDARKS